MLTLAVLSMLAAAPKSQSVYDLKQDAFVASAKADLVTLKMFVSGMHGVLDKVKENDKLFTASSNLVYSPEQKRTLLSTWGALFAYFSAIEGLRQKYWNFVALSPTDGRHAWGFLVTHTALAALLSSGLRFTEAALNNKQLETLFDEANDEFGIPKGAFAAFKSKAVHVATSTQLLTGDAWSLAAGLTLKKEKDDSVKWAMAEMETDSKQAKSELTRRGVKLFAGNAADIAKDKTLEAVFPAQRTFAEWAGDTRVARQGKPLITRKDVDALVLPKILPGDIVVTRQNWFLSNIGLPGFWPHAMIFVGTPTDLAGAFDKDADVQTWAAAQPEKVATLSELLAKRYPEKWKTYTAGIDFQGHSPIRVIESISEGVSFTAVDHAFGVDYLGVMRPKLAQVDKAKAVERAFKYQGRPYDFDFDFFSDSTLVCTELVFKSYQPAADMKGVQLDLVDVAGRRTLPANDVVRQFDQQLESPNHVLDFVLFVDGKENEDKAFDSTLASFRSSWKRVKWDVVQK